MADLIECEIAMVHMVKPCDGPVRWIVDDDADQQVYACDSHLPLAVEDFTSDLGSCIVRPLVSDITAELLIPPGLDPDLVVATDG